MPHMIKKITPGPEFHEDGTVTVYENDGFSHTYERPQFDIFDIDIEQKYKESYDVLSRLIRGLGNYGIGLSDLFGEDEHLMQAINDAKVFIGAKPYSSDDE